MSLGEKSFVILAPEVGGFNKEAENAFVEPKEEVTTVDPDRLTVTLLRQSLQRHHVRHRLQRRLAVKILIVAVVFYREMEYIERSSFIEIYWSLARLAHFMIFTLF